MSGTTPKWALPYSQGSDLINTIDNTDLAAKTLLDSLLSPYDAGTFASRPVSTAGSPGKSGREYYATDTGRLYKDLGTSWIELRIDRNAEAKLKTVRGIVASTGAVVGGAGFTAVRDLTGFYTITFSPPFSAGGPSIVASAVGIGFKAEVGAVSPTTVAIRTSNSADSDTDHDFHFIASGP